MTDQSMDPQYEQEPHLVDDAVPSIQAGITWRSGGVTISLPSVENAEPSSVSWDGANATRSGGNYDGTGNNTTNSLSVTYPSGTYSNSSIPRDTRTVTLTR